MSFATRADLLARGSANRIAQLACPTDMKMVQLDAVRAVLSGGDVSGYPTDVQAILALALGTVDAALADADALILSYGIPATVQTTLLARLASTAALYYLQGAERMTDGVSKAFDGVLDTLKAHARGDLNLVPALPTDTAPAEDHAVIESGRRRYGVVDPDEIWNGL